MSKYIVILFFASFTLSAQRLNEVCPSNFNNYEHYLLDNADWLELYNPTGLNINLGGYFLTDNLSEPEKWVFPETIIWSEGYFMLHFGVQQEFSTAVNFSLPIKGGALYLSNPAGEVIDSLHYPELLPNDSYGLLGEDYYYFDTPSADASNELSTGYKGYAESPTIARKSGAYPVGTTIVIRPVNSEDIIYYQINGQTIAEANIYTEPISISKTTAIKAFTSNDSLINSIPTYGAYFVNENHFLPVVHLMVDSLDMFDETTGIYMHGPDASPDYPFEGANFWQDIEIEAHYTYFDSNLVFVEALQCDLKIHGGLSSRPYPMKSFQIRAKNSYDPSYFEKDYFEHKPINKFKRLVLRNSGNDNCKTCMLDGILHNYFLENNLNIDLLGYLPTVLYLNGHYRGIQNLREKSDRYYISTHYDVNPDEINLLVDNFLTEIDGTSLSFEELTTYTIENNLQDPVHFNWVEEQMDLKSMVDYFSVELYINNRDWPNNNIKVWNAPGHKWRYICYDLDFAFRYYGNEPGSRHTLTDVLDKLYEINPHVAIFTELLENESFKHYFVNRYSDLINTMLQPAAIHKIFADGRDKLAPDMPRYFEKWCGPVEKWDDQINALNDFIDNRPDIAFEDISLAFDLPNRSELKIDNYPTHAGTVQLNTISLESFPFYGTYFETNTIDMTAIPNPGQVFDHWINLRDGQVWYSEMITVDPIQADEFVAVYKSEKSLFHLSVAPNPVEGYLNLTYSLPESSPVTIDLVDISGKRLIYTEDPEILSKGTHRVSLDMKNHVPGIYLLYLTTDQGRETIQISKN